MANKVGIVLICTRRYDQFLRQFVMSAEEFFFKGEPFDIYLLTDKAEVYHHWGSTGRASVEVFEIPSYVFPWATLCRYKEITRYAEQISAEHVFYSDIDMRFVSPVGEEILCNGLTAVRHPGYYRNNGWGSPNTSPYSLAYLKPELRYEYFCGGFQGGRQEEYLKACAILSGMINADLDTATEMGYTDNGGILAQWYDETFWNWYLKMYPPAKVLSPEYCMVEQLDLREKWGIADLQPKLLALAKDHKKIRS